jgi:hypothetical protein
MENALPDSQPLPLYAGIVIEAPLTTVFHYRIPEQLRSTIMPGDRALIPFGNRRTRGGVSFRWIAPFIAFDRAPERFARPEHVFEAKNLLKYCRTL